MRLKNKRTLITGGAQGIGAAIAERFMAEGAEVIVLDKNTDKLKMLSSRIPGLKGAICADVSRPEEVNRAFQESDNLLGGIDILINNAGISLRHAFLDIKPEEWREVMAVNLDGVFFTAQQAAVRMVRPESSGGVILNMGSTNGIVGYPFYADYNASKAAVIELTRSMALELAPRVRVNVICPGYVLTPMQAAEYTDEMIEESQRKIPLKRWASTEEVASLFAFLASDEAAYITGQSFVIDGGEIAGGLASR